MKDSIKTRVLKESDYIINTGQTVREIAKKFNVSKSTVYIDLTNRLYNIDRSLYIKVSTILKEHLDIRHIKGGEATKLKYLLKNANYMYKTPMFCGRIITERNR